MSSLLVDNETLVNPEQVSPSNTSTFDQSFAMGEDKIFTYVTEGLVLSIVSVFGIIGNLLSLGVRIRSSGRESFSNHLRGLAAFDSFFLIMALLTMGLPKLCPSYEEGFFMDFVNVLFGLLHTARVGSVCFTVSVNVERLCVIVFPLKPCAWKRHLIPLSCLIAVLYDLPRFFEFHVITNPRSGRRSVITSELRDNAYYVSLYVFWSKFIFFELIPYMTILICNIFIILKIRRSQRFRLKFHSSEPDLHSNVTELDAERLSGINACMASMHGQQIQTSLVLREPSNKFPKKSFLKKQAEEHHLGTILVGLSSLFIICQSFKILPDLHEIFWCTPGEPCLMEGYSNSVMRLSHLLVCFNSAANFLIYYMNGEKFRVAWSETYWRPIKNCLRSQSSKLSRSQQGSFRSVTAGRDVVTRGSNPQVVVQQDLFNV